MTSKMLLAAALAALPPLGVPASAHAPAPLLPTALVEDVKSTTADVEFMDYVGNRQVIKLAPGDVLVLSYLRSCAHETITGGTVTIGMERSDVRDGQVVRTKVPCDGGKVQLTSAQAAVSAASAFRLQSAEGELTLFGRTPIMQMPKDLTPEERTLIIRRTDRPGERHEVKLDTAFPAGGFYDLSKNRVQLASGGTYEATVGNHKVTFHLDRGATSGSAAIVSRLVRFQ
jgi:hypothetical protein